MFESRGGFIQVRGECGKGEILLSSLWVLVMWGFLCIDDQGPEVWVLVLRCDSLVIDSC